VNKEEERREESATGVEGLENRPWLITKGRLRKGREELNVKKEQKVYLINKNVEGKHAGHLEKKNPIRTANLRAVVKKLKPESGGKKKKP